MMVMNENKFINNAPLAPGHRLSDHGLLQKYDRIISGVKKMPSIHPKC